MKTSGVVAATLFAMAAVSPAFAADLAPAYKAPVYKAPPEVPYGWTQWYIGGEVGGKWGKDNWDTTCVQVGGIETCGTRANNAAFPGAPDSSSPHSFTTSGVRAGIYGGATFQVAPSWVVGFEGDYAFSHQSSTVQGLVGCTFTACANFAPGTPFIDSTSVKFGDDASVRLRGGFLVTPDVLVYGTGGVAFQQLSASMSCDSSLTSPACINPHSETIGKWLTGWTVGGGVEWKLWHNWLVRGEYRYADFGSFKPTFFQGSGTEILTNQKVTTQIATFGLAYSFPISK